jgi:hypothetical protein
VFSRRFEVAVHVPGTEEEGQRAGAKLFVAELLCEGACELAEAMCALGVGGPESYLPVHVGRSEDTAKGNRPSFSHAARPENAEPIYQAFCSALEAEGVEVARGVFGARMQVELVNDGPVTIVVET